MENYVGNICPFCKSEFTESDAVKVCPACGIPHHERCWNENHGCTTFGCSEQDYEAQYANPTDACPTFGSSEQDDKAQRTIILDVCTNCGTPMGDDRAFCPKCGTPKATTPKNIVCTNCGNPMGDDQAFCPKCGAPKVAAPIVAAPKPAICSRCGAELQEGQVFCAKCGQSTIVAVETTTNDAINRFNAGVEKKKKKSKALPIIIAAILVVAIGIGAFVSSAVRAKKAEELKKEYIENAEAFLSLSITAAVNLEVIADTVQEYWYDSIWYDMWGGDIDTAIYYALLAKSTELGMADAYDVQVRDLYAKIKKVPDGLAKDDVDDIEELCEAVRDLYNSYADYYNFATDPSGSYNTFSEGNGEMKDEFLSCYNTLEDLLD